VLEACKPFEKVLPGESVQELKALLVKFESGITLAERLLTKWSAGGGKDQALASMLQFRLFEVMSMEAEVRSFIGELLQRELVVDFDEESSKENFRMEVPRWFRKMLSLLKSEIARRGQRNVEDHHLIIDAVRFAVMNQESFLAMPSIRRRSATIVMPRRNAKKSGKANQTSL
jgi:hypothetical protein